MPELESFYIEFTANNLQLRKSISEVKTDLTNLEKTINNGQESTKALDFEFSKFGETLLKVGGTLASFVGISQGLRHAGDYAQSLHQASKELNVNQSALEAWQRAVEQSGGSAEGFQSTVKKISDTLLIPNSQVLGLLPQFAEMFESYGHQKAFRIGESFGFDTGTILFLSQGREKVEELLEAQYRLGLGTDKDTKIIYDFNNALKDTKSILTTFGVIALGEILPGATEFQQKFQDFLVKAKDTPEFMEKIRVALYAVGIAAELAAIGLIAVFAPFAGWAIAITGLSAALAILYNDLQKFNSGEDSFTGKTIDKIKSFNSKIDSGLESIGFGFLLDSSNATLDPKYDQIKENGGLIGPRRNKLEEMANSYGSSPINNQNSSIFNSNSNSNKTTNYNQKNEITIETQSSNPSDIVAAISGTLERQNRLAMSQVDDGVLA